MAFADSVPGVSGGTIAYITGKYDELIISINTLTSTSSKIEKKRSLKFLTKLGIGWVFGFIVAVLFISSILESHIYELSSLFIGFIVSSVPFIVKEEWHVLKTNFKNIFFTILGIVIVASISYFSSTTIKIVGESMSILSYLYIFVAGIIAISAMLLPGISGSTLLIIFGLYVPIITALKNVLKFDFSGLLICMVFGFGILFGLKYTTAIISKVLSKFRAPLIYLIIGFMLGSLYAIVIGPTTLVDEVTNQSLNLEALSFKTFSFFSFVAGVLIISLLDFVRIRK